MKKYRNNYFKWIIFIFEFCFLFALQRSRLIPEVYGARPVLILPLFVCCAMFEDKNQAAILGFFAGALLDLSAGNIIGIQSMLLGFIGYFIANLFNSIFKINFLTAFLTNFISLPIIFFFRFLIFLLNSGISFDYEIFINHFLVSAAYTICFMPVAYYFSRVVAFKIYGGGDSNAY